MHSPPMGSPFNCCHHSVGLPWVGICPVPVVWICTLVALLGSCAGLSVQHLCVKTGHQHNVPSFCSTLCTPSIKMVQGKRFEPSPYAVTVGRTISFNPRSVVELEAHCSSAWYIIPPNTVCMSLRLPEFAGLASHPEAATLSGSDFRQPGT